jgi:predicted transcriptional regulator
LECALSDQNDDLRNLVAEVAAAYFANSHVGVSEISRVIAEISTSLGAIGGAPATPTEQPAEPPAPPKPTSAQIRKSITPEALISFEDGRPYKTLRRHLSVKGLTPEQYREKWGLPRDYPIVAASYSEARSKMARELGLGNRRPPSPTTSAAATSRRRRSAPTES